MDFLEWLQPLGREFLASDTLEYDAAKSEDNLDMLVSQPVLSERSQPEHMTGEGVAVVTCEEGQGPVLVLPEAGVEVDEGEGERGEGEDGLDGSHWIQFVPYQATNQKYLPNLERSCGGIIQSVLFRRGIQTWKLNYYGLEKLKITQLVLKCLESIYLLTGVLNYVMIHWFKVLFIQHHLIIDKKENKS